MPAPRNIGLNCHGLGSERLIVEVGVADGRSSCDAHTDCLWLTAPWPRASTGASKLATLVIFTWDWLQPAPAWHSLINHNHNWQWPSDHYHNAPLPPPPPPAPWLHRQTLDSDKFINIIFETDLNASSCIKIYTKFTNSSLVYVTRHWQEIFKSIIHDD